MCQRFSEHLARFFFSNMVTFRMNDRSPWRRALLSCWSIRWCLLFTTKRSPTCAASRTWTWMLLSNKRESSASQGQDDMVAETRSAMNYKKGLLC